MVGAIAALVQLEPFVHKGTACVAPAASPIAVSPLAPTACPSTVLQLSGMDVTAWATIVLAAIAALALTANVTLAASTRDLANATSLLADTSKTTIDEIRIDRELAYRPQISWLVIELATAGELVTGNPKVHVANFGRGPALHCLCVAFWPKVMVRARSTLLFDLSPNEKGDVATEARDWQVPGPDVTGPPPSGPVPTGWPSVRVAFSQDQIGNSYRFVPYKVDADVWRPKDDPRPAWLDWYEARRKDLEKI